MAFEGYFTFFFFSHATADDVEQFDRIYRILHTESETHRYRMSKRGRQRGGDEIQNVTPLIANDWLTHRMKKKIVNLSLSLSRFFLCSLHFEQQETHFITLFSSLGPYLYLPTFVSISHNKQLSAAFFKSDKNHFSNRNAWIEKKNRSLAKHLGNQ